MLVYRQSTNIVKVYVYASERSERARKFWHFYILKVLFQYFVGTSDILSVQIICLSANMYRQISKCTDKTLKKALLGGGAVAPLPPPPPLWLC